MGRCVAVLFLLSIGFALARAGIAAGAVPGTVAILAEPVPVANDQFGAGEANGIAMSADGRVALLTARSARVGGQSHSGKVFFYRYSNAHWTQVQEIDDPDHRAQDYFGDTVALSANGAEALVGSHATVDGREGAGKAYLYVLNGPVWTLAHEFDEPSGASHVYFGSSALALSEDGETAAIAADMAHVGRARNAGMVYIYRYSQGAWAEDAALQDPDAADDDYFGFAIALSGNGRLLLAGSSAQVAGKRGAGKAYLFVANGSSWHRSHEFDDPSPADDDNFGDAGVALAPDGHMAVIGASGKSVDGIQRAGAAYIYESGDGWKQSAVLDDPNAAAGDGFGAPVVSVNGMGVFIGSDAAVAGAEHAGKAYLYCRDGRSWIKTREFDDPVSGRNDHFGHSGVAFSRKTNTLLLSASGTAVKAVPDAGAVYSFQLHTPACGAKGYRPLNQVIGD